MNLLEIFNIEICQSYRVQGEPRTLFECGISFSDALVDSFDMEEVKKKYRTVSDLRQLHRDHHRFYAMEMQEWSLEVVVDEEKSSVKFVDQPIGKSVPIEFGEVLNK